MDAIVNVQVPEKIAKQVWKRTILFMDLYNKIENDGWIDIKLETPVDMENFYDTLNKEL